MSWDLLAGSGLGKGTESIETSSSSKVGVTLSVLSCEHGSAKRVVMALVSRKRLQKLR